MCRNVLLISLALLLASPAAADDRFRLAGAVPEILPEDMSDRFMLENNCSPMKFSVSLSGTDVEKVGLKHDAIETTVRSRLRAARLFNATGKPPFSFPTLYLDVGVAGTAYSINLEYRKHVEDLWSNVRAWVITWKEVSLGTHSQNAIGASFILSHVSQHLDKFVDEYLRVNAKACTRVE